MNRYFLDPSNLSARRLVGDLTFEMVERYPVTGVYLNDLRYPRPLTEPGSNRLARDLEAFRKETSEDPETDDGFRKLLAWRNEQLNDTLHYLRCRLGRGNQRTWIVSQAVGPYDSEEAPAGIQGDWGRWLSQQYLDGAAPSYRGMSDEEFYDALEWDIAMAPLDRAIYPLVDKGFLRDSTERPVIVRQLPLAGLVFRSFHRLEDEDWKRIQRLFERPAVPLAKSPYGSARLALAESARLMSSNQGICEFFSDLLKLVPVADDRNARLSDRQTNSINQNLENVARKIEEGEIRSGVGEEYALRWIRLVRQCLSMGRRF